MKARAIRVNVFLCHRPWAGGKRPEGTLSANWPHSIRGHPLTAYPGNSGGQRSRPASSRRPLTGRDLPEGAQRIRRTGLRPRRNPLLWTAGTMVGKSQAAEMVVAEQGRNGLATLE